MAYQNQNYSSATNGNLKPGDVVNKSFRKSKKKDCYYLSFVDNGKVYTVLCYENVYTPGSGKYTNVESRVGKILVSKKQ